MAQREDLTAEEKMKKMQELATPEGLYKDKQRILSMLNARQGFDSGFHSVESMCEIAAAYAFGLKLLPPNETYNAQAADGTLVRINVPDEINAIAPVHLIVVEWLAMNSECFRVVYNGLSESVWENHAVHSLQERTRNRRGINRSRHERLIAVLQQLDAAATRKLPQLHALPKVRGYC